MACKQWLAVVAVLVFSGCATLGPRTEGVDGPIEWKAIDLKLDRKDLSSPWVYSFLLRLRHAQDRRVTFTEMEALIYQPGVGTSSITHKRQWVIPAGGQVRIPLQSSLRCRGVEGACLGTNVPNPLWKITLTGTDDTGRAVRAVVDLQLPADPAGTTR